MHKPPVSLAMLPREAENLRRLIARGAEALPDLGPLAALLDRQLSEALAKAAR